MIIKILLRVMLVLSLVTFASALFVFGTTTVGAQPSPPGRGDAPRPPRPPPPRIDALLSALQLTAAQTISVQNTLNAERTAIRALDDALRVQREAIHSKTRVELAATLTPDQLKRYDEWREANRPPRPPNEPGRRSEMPSNDFPQPVR